MERYLGDRTADEYRAHMTAIKDITDSWQRGDIGVVEKRARIAAENTRFYNGEHQGAGPSITSEPRIVDELAYVLSDGNGMPLEAVRAALHARRVANIKAANADSRDEARRLIDEGRQGYAEIMATAR